MFAQHYPKTSQKNKKLINSLMMVVVIINPLIAFPQLYQIVKTKDAIGVSSLTWGLGCIFSIAWIFYGIAHREKIIVFNSTIGAILSFCIFIVSSIY